MELNKIKGKIRVTVRRDTAINSLYIQATIRGDYGRCYHSSNRGTGYTTFHCFYSLFLRIPAVRGYVLFLACASVLSLLFVPFFFVVLFVCVFVCLFVCFFLYFRSVVLLRAFILYLIHLGKCTHTINVKVHQVVNA